jgi:tRNA (guanine9-N1)-methyltransferase
MNDAGYKRWVKTEWWHEGYEKLWADQVEEEGVENVKRNTVYLTADSEQELTELKENETYIIGGICDHNRYKVSPGHGDRHGAQQIG